tara:strand:- start:1643 stop:1888 length:246 start_codon:yes stop_codon:yes gene_type:complete
MKNRTVKATVIRQQTLPNGRVQLHVKKESGHTMSVVTLEDDTNNSTQVATNWQGMEVCMVLKINKYNLNNLLSIMPAQFEN